MRLNMSSAKMVPWIKQKRLEQTLTEAGSKIWVCGLRCKYCNHIKEIFQRILDSKKTHPGKNKPIQNIKHSCRSSLLLSLCFRRLCRLCRLFRLFRHSPRVRCMFTIISLVKHNPLLPLLTWRSHSCIHILHPGRVLCNNATWEIRTQKWRRLEDRDIILLNS
jgi:hypothetical protein